MNNLAIFVNIPCERDVETVDKEPFKNSKVLENELVIDGEHFSIPRPLENKTGRYCELTIQYWAWINTHYDYYGFCQNNRLFSFAEDCFEGNSQNWIWFYYLNDNTIRKLALDDHAIRNKLSSCDFWVSQPYKVAYDKIWDYYISDEFPLHRKSDLENVYNVLCSVHSEDMRYADEYLNGNYIYPDNLFAASRTAFADYSEWLFSILFKAEERMDYVNRSKEALEAFRDISVFLLGIFYLKIKAEGKYKVGELQRAFIERDEKRIEIEPLFGGEAILIASSDYYVPYCAVTLQSIVDNSSNDETYDIVIFQQDMTKEHMAVLTDIGKGKDNISIRFCDPRAFIDENERFKEIALDFNVTRFPPILAYRAFVPYILEKFRKVVWLDCDLVFEHDIAELFHIDMHGKIGAFVNDIVICSYANGADKTMGTYYTNAFIMKDIYQYGNAGVVMLDLNRFRAEISFDYLLDKSTEYKHKIPEQDTINSVLEGKTVFLDKRWNLVAFGPGPEWLQRFVPKDAYDEYKIARKEPFVVHYVGPDKPWQDTTIPMAEHFWKYARRSPYYEMILQRLFDNSQNAAMAKDSQQSKIRRMADKLLPVGTKRRELVKSVLPKRGSLGWNRMKKIYYLCFNRNENDI